MVDFGKVWNLQKTENASKGKVESARKGNCKQWNFQGHRFASKGYMFYHMVNASYRYLKINVQTSDISSEFKTFKSFCGLNVQLILAGVKFTSTLTKFGILH